MQSIIIASAVAGFAASAQAAILSTAAGQAKVISNCQENVYVSNVACDATMAPINTILNSSNPTYTQNFAEVSGNCGWSIKLGSDPSLPGDNIIQYEYTWQGAGQPVWYDMSLVNQNGDSVFPWSFSSSNTAVCDPNNANYFTDATTTTGMQTSCPDDVTLTLYLCGTGSSSGSSSSSSSAAPSTSSAAPSTSSAAPSTTSAAPSTSTSSSKSQTTLATSTRKGHGWTVQEANVAPATTLTTSAAVSSSSVSSSTAADGVVVTETDVFYVTEVATTYVQARNAEATPAPHERRHAHGHAHAHPHGVRA